MDIDNKISEWRKKQGQIIKDAIIQNKVVIEKMASDIGIAKRTIYKIINSEGNYRVDQLLKILLYLDLPIEKPY